MRSVISHRIELPTLVTLETEESYLTSIPEGTHEYWYLSKSIEDCRLVKFLDHLSGGTSVVSIRQ